jgi:hypothetical protein
MRTSFCLVLAAQVFFAAISMANPCDEQLTGKNMLISITRLKLGKLKYLLPFALENKKLLRQVSRSTGFVSGQLLVDKHLVFWTATVWRDQRSMLAFRNSGYHGRVMPKLKLWCSEATTFSFESPTTDLPSWPALYEKLRAEGKVAFVEVPTSSHASKEFLPPKVGRLRKYSLYPNSIW